MPNIYNLRGSNSSLKDSNSTFGMLPLLPGQNQNGEGFQQRHEHVTPTLEAGGHNFDGNGYPNSSLSQMPLHGAAAYEADNQGGRQMSARSQIPSQSDAGAINHSPTGRESNNGVFSVSRMFHRHNLRSLSLASVSELTKAQIANYVN